MIGLGLGLVLFGSCTVSLNHSVEEVVSHMPSWSQLLGDTYSANLQYHMFTLPSTLKKKLLRFPASTIATRLSLDVWTRSTLASRIFETAL